MRVLRIILLECVFHEMDWSNQINGQPENLFDATGYPLTGDMPLLNRKHNRSPTTCIQQLPVALTGSSYSWNKLENFSAPTDIYSPGNVPSPLLFQLADPLGLCWGTRVSIREHPYIVSIRKKNSHYLTGTLITKNLVLTVAHPLLGVPVHELRIVVGENYSDRGTSLLTVILVVVHQNFDSFTLEADLAMIRFYEDAEFKSSVKTISLVMPKTPLANFSAYVTGWGRCDFTGKELCLPRSSQFYPDEYIDPMLRTVSVTITSPNLYCEGYTKHEINVDKGMLCAGTAREEDPSVSCLAVPGAPMVIHAKLAGILSWGFGCGYLHDLPLIYTSVQHYTLWIAQNIVIFRKLSKEDLIPLFQSTKSYVVLEWLSKTRVLKPSSHNHGQYRDITQLELDLELAKLHGDIYDIRDFVGSTDIHEKKKNMYEAIRNYQKQNSTNKSGISFLSGKIKTYPFISNKTLAKINFDYEDSDEEE